MRPIAKRNIRPFQMKIFLIALFLNLVVTEKISAQTIDTLVDVGTHKMHFHIIKGKEIPILFEAGAERDASAWGPILEQLSVRTGATIIAYDRAGFGKSTLNADTTLSKHGIISNVEDLETGLRTLGYDHEIMLVSHSYGGYLTTLYSYRHPELVKSVVLIDVNMDLYAQDKYLQESIKAEAKLLPAYKKSNLGLYYLHATFPETAKLMEKYTIPAATPIVDLVRELPAFFSKSKFEDYKAVHQQFVRGHRKCTSITAYGCGHGIWLDNPPLVIAIISKAYAEILPENEKMKLYERTLNYSINAINESKMVKKKK
ncbi:MAG TPA: alpha/beta hydrolase [Bacteroidia bacterium]|nr:alpha/beta hydrolase [Bacteroidia bacterium]